MSQNPYEPAAPGAVFSRSGARHSGVFSSPQRLVAMEEEPEEKMIEAALRPKSLDDFVGQRRVRQQLSLVLEGFKMRGRSADHVLLSGPPGLGKTTLAMIIAAEMEALLRITSGPAIQHSGDLAAILSSLTPGEVLFLDEIHRMSRPAEEMLYMAMEDFRVDIVVSKVRVQPPFRWSCHSSPWSVRRPVRVFCPVLCVTASVLPVTWSSTRWRSLSWYFAVARV